MAKFNLESCILKPLNDGMKMKIPNTFVSCVANHILQHGYYWETYTTSLINKAVKPGMNAVEIGGHIGYHSINIASHVGSGGKFWVFEANGDLTPLIEENLRINDLSTFSEVIQKGVYSETCKKTINITNDKGTTSLYHDLCDANRTLVMGHIEETIEIDCVSLDDYFKDQKIDFIKIDIEGAETDAIKGAYNLFKNNNIQMIAEWWHSMPQNLVEETFFDLLGGLGYKTYGIYPNDILTELKTYADFTNRSRYEDLYVCRA